MSTGRLLKLQFPFKTLCQRQLISITMVWKQTPFCSLVICILVGLDCCTLDSPRCNKNHYEHNEITVLGWFRQCTGIKEGRNRIDNNFFLSLYRAFFIRLIFFYQQMHFYLTYKILNIKIYIKTLSTLHAMQHTHHNLTHMLPQYCANYNDIILLIVSTNK